MRRPGPAQLRADRSAGPLIAFSGSFARPKAPCSSDDGADQGGDAEQSEEDGDIEADERPGDPDKRTGDDAAGRTGNLARRRARTGESIKDQSGRDADRKNDEKRDGRRHENPPC